MVEIGGTLGLHGGQAPGSVVSRGGFFEDSLSSAYGAWTPSGDQTIDGVTVQSGAAVSLNVGPGGSISGFRRHQRRVSVRRGGRLGERDDHRQRRVRIYRLRRLGCGRRHQRRERALYVRRPGLLRTAVGYGGYGPSESLDESCGSITGSAGGVGVEVEDGGSSTTRGRSAERRRPSSSSARARSCSSSGAGRRWRAPCSAAPRPARATR